MDLSFDTVEKRTAALSNFTTLLDHPGWQLVRSIVDFNIGLLEKQILEGVGDGETIETINRLRDKLAIHKEIINTPNNMIEKLTPSVTQEVSIDPYDSE